MNPNWQQLQEAAEALREVQQQVDWQQLQEAAKALQNAQEQEARWQQMQNKIREEAAGDLTHFNKDDIVKIGTSLNIGRDEAVQLFESHKGVAWQGDYILSGDDGWVGAWVERVY